MKNIISKLNEVGDIPILFTKRCLELVMLSCAMLITYCLILDAREAFILKEVFRIRDSVEYLVAGTALCVSFGFLLDLAIKKQ